ncbi:MAG TPA: hypothetical protein VF412_06235 [Bdellovibrio sp.]|uniref:hypothetical protein n=1 Tax=Bdellovibrio sp. TaxID=28201 RepID=UPI002EE0A3DA
MNSFEQPNKIQSNQATDKPKSCQASDYNALEIDSQDSKDFKNLEILICLVATVLEEADHHVVVG